MKRSPWLLVAGLAAAALVPAVIVGVALLVRPPAGPPLASTAITSGQAFELSYPSDGRATRVLLDLACEACSLPVDGALDITAGTTSVRKVEISAGERSDLTSSYALDEQPLTDVPAQPSGVVVTVRGTLTVPGARGVLGPTSGAPLPTVQRLRVFVAH